MATQSATPCKSGFNPTDASTLRDRPAPIKNKVSVKPALAMLITYGLINLTTGI